MLVMWSADAVGFAAGGASDPTSTLADVNFICLQYVRCTEVEQKHVQGNLQNFSDWAKEPNKKLNEELESKLKR
mgnify:CR=1 FL=1|jgi:hypothetical protein